MLTSRIFCAAFAGALVVSSLVAGTARADAVAALVEECLIQLEMTESACECVGDSAADELSLDEQDFVLALVWGDDAMADEIAQDLTDEEIDYSLAWMDQVPAECEFE